MTRKDISDALGGIKSDYIEEAATPSSLRPRRSGWQIWLSAAACLCLAMGFAVFALTAPFGGTGTVLGSDSGEMAGCSSEAPGGIDPILLVNGRHYAWTGVSFATFAHEGSIVFDTSTSFLPNGYEEYGALGAVSEAYPTEDLQMQAGFDAAGTVYVHPNSPEHVYVLMTTDWFDGYYIRFCCVEPLEQKGIYYQGKFYQASCAEKQTRYYASGLPTHYQFLGALTFIGLAQIPDCDLETNCFSDPRHVDLDGREVFYDPVEDVLCVRTPDNVNSYYMYQSIN